MEMRDRLERIRPDRDQFLAKLKAERASIYKVTHTAAYQLTSATDYICSV